MISDKSTRLLSYLAEIFLISPPPPPSLPLANLLRISSFGRIMKLISDRFKTRHNQFEFYRLSNGGSVEVNSFSSPEPSVSFGHVVGETKSSGRSHYRMSVNLGEQVKICTFSGQKQQLCTPCTCVFPFCLGRHHLTINFHFLL